MPALSSSPGQAPTHEERHFSEGKVAAVGPTSAMICCAESTPRPGTSASRSTAPWCWLSRLAISLSSWPICCSRNCNCSSAIFRSCRYTGFRSVHAPSASHNCSGVARKRSSAKAARAAGLVSPSASTFSIRRALTPNRSVTKLDNLMWASSRRDSNWFCSRTRSYLNWYFLRVTVRHRRCSAAGTQLRVNSWATSRFTRRSASGKSLLRPRRPRLDCACARCNVPDLRFAPSRFSRIGFQYLSSAPHTGFQYWAVDSMTTSSASCSINHAASDRKLFGVAAKHTSLYEHRFPFQLFCRTSLPPGPERRACCGYLNQAHGLSPLPRGRQRRPIIRSIKHAPDQTGSQLRLLHCCIDLAAPSRCDLTSK